MIRAEIISMRESVSRCKKLRIGGKIKTQIWITMLAITEYQINIFGTNCLENIEYVSDLELSKLNSWAKTKMVNVIVWAFMRSPDVE